MPNALSTPTMLGLYINSFKKGNNTDPYTQLLGTDGFGNYANGNKLTALFNYTTQYNYNYALFYGLSDSDFVSSGVTSANFSAQGASILDTVMPLAHAAGLTDRAAISDVAQPQMAAAIQGASVYYGKYDGLSQIQKVINYNQSVSYDSTKAFTWINLETEFWNFPYNIQVRSTGVVQVGNPIPADPKRPRTRVTIPVGSTATFLGIGVNDFISISGEWRQVIAASPTELLVDRPFSSNWNLAFGWIEFDGTVDYDTFLYRTQKLCAYINEFGNGELVDIYVGFPSIDFKGTSSAQTAQLARLYQAGVTKILLTNYTRKPNFDYINANYASGGNYTGTLTTGSTTITNISLFGVFGVTNITGNGIPNGTTVVSFNSTNNTAVISQPAISSGVKTLHIGAAASAYHRVSDDIVSDGTLRELGQIMSLESATRNNNNQCNGGIFTSNNFVGYFAEGRSILPHTNNTDFKAVDAGNLPITCDCCGTPMFQPPVTYNSLQMDELWQYVAETPPVGAGYPTAGSTTFNEYITSGVGIGPDLDDYIDFNTLIVFDQELMRQLVITPAEALNASITGTDETCFGASDGAASVLVTGGTLPYTYLWDDPSSSTTQSITGLAPGTYSCLVTDFLGVTTTPSITINAAPQITFDTSIGYANCAGIGATVSFTDVVGPGNYLYSIVPLGDSPIWQSSPSFPGLNSGNYTASVASGNPANGCILSATITIGSASSPTITQTHTNVTGCIGQNNGSIHVTISASAGTSPYIYNLYNNANVLLAQNTSAFANTDFTNLTSGVYKITCVNASGCTSNTLTVTITEPTAITINNINVSPTCFLGTDGSITLTASNGTGPYTYILESSTGVITSNSTGIFSDLAAGNYTYYVTDSLGCSSDIFNTTLDNPDPIVAVYTVTQISQGLTNNGSIILANISGGSPGYAYLWSTGETTDSISNLEAGSYTVYITDENDCTAQYTFNIRVQCTELSYDEYKVQIYKAQCCVGKLAKQYVQFQKQGREDLSFPVMEKIKKLTLIIDAIKCDDNPGNEYCFSCDEMIQLLENVKNICACDCCDDANTETVNVTFNPNTNQLDII